VVLTELLEWFIEKTVVDEIAVPETRRNFGNPGEGERLPLEAVMRGLVKAQ
jgi:hypothetical protein